MVYYIALEHMTFISVLAILLIGTFIVSVPSEEKNKDK
jgi:hypothetical protein